MLLLLVAACSDYDVNGKDEGGVFDPGDTADVPDTDTDTAVDTDTAPVEDTASCPDQAFPGGPVATRDECGSSPTVGTFEPVEEWKWETFSTSASFNNVMMTPIVVSLTDDDGDGDADGDDIPDIVFVTYTDTDWSDIGVIRAVSGDGSAELWSVAGENIDGCSGLAGADLDGDGQVEIVAVTYDKKVKAFDADGALVWTSGQYAANFGAYSSTPAISDMDGDGSPEVIVGSLILNNDGSLRGAGDHGVGANGVYGTTSFAVDLDGDGAQELVTGNALYDIDGTALWYNAQPDGYVAAADFDGDGIGEIVVTANAQVRLQDVDGTVLWDTAIPRASGSYGGPPTVADFDGDGEPEVGVAANSTYTVFETDGSVLWQVTTQDGSSGVTGSAVFDFEGDGIAEAIYPDETRLWAFNGPDGATKLESADHTNWTVIEYAPIADVDADGEAEIVVPNGLHPSYSGARHGISVIGDAAGSWRAGRRIWNQHAYHITNIDDDGTVPAAAALNWDSYNNFRSGDLAAASGGLLPNLVVDIEDVCLSYCDGGRILAWVQVGNDGFADVDGPVTVELWGETAAGVVWLAEETVGAVAWGTSVDALLFDVVGVDTATLVALQARVDGGDTSAGDWDECVEDDDSDRWTDVYCP
ncbi:MAG: VCBS repeat-containing protein [Pseudomonadota bacterium]|nr:VCBS repeat-containing protein [Pseudomonadota bacterium]